MKTKEIQAENFHLTINNPLKYNLSHEQILNTLLTKFKTFRYVAMADEKGETHHTHAFISFTSRVRISTLKKYFYSAHIESAKGSVKSNIEYLKKSGKWASDEKHKTSIEGTFIEYGTPPPESTGKRADMTALYQYVLDGWTNAEIIAKNQDYILQLDKIDKLRTTILQSKFRSTRRLDLETTYVFGRTGMGKSRDILDTFSDECVFRITNYRHPFDGYNCEPVIVFEEFRNSIPLGDMLQYLDIYALSLPARYSDKYACYTHVFICSNWSLEQQYKEIQDSHSESWNAFLRRIHKVKEYTDNGVIEYSSVHDYFEQKNNFVPTYETPFKHSEV
ncbi:MAG: hypothetical protein IJV71_00980 [Lachnospiraceae bacterium]|nr:hypothetical protein [Lachnospiraceae bacterium]